MESVPTLKSIKCGAAMQLKNQRKQHSNGLHLLRSNLFTNISKSIMKISMKSTAIFLFFKFGKLETAHIGKRILLQRETKDRSKHSQFLAPNGKKRTKAKLKSTMYVPCPGRRME
jgi:hypothetical protein